MWRALQITLRLENAYWGDIAHVRHGRRAAEHDVHDVEAYLLPGNFRVPRVIASSAHQGGPFLAANGAVRSTVFIRLAGFNLNEDERVAVPADEVELAGTGRGAVVPRNHYDAGALKMAMGDIFTAAAERVVGCHVPLAAAMPQIVGELVQEAYHSSL